MRKWIFTWLAIFLALLLDVCVIPACYTGSLSVSLLLVLSFVYGMEGGFTPGLLVGLISGLLADISAGVMGDTLLACLALGILGAVLARRRTDIVSRRWKSRLFRGIRVLVLCLLTEGAALFYRYYQAGEFDISYIWPCLFRAVLLGALSYLLSPLVRRILYGNWRERITVRTGEEKKF